MIFSDFKRGDQGRTSTFNRGVARFSSLNDVAAKPPTSSAFGGLFGWLTGGKSRSMPPLDFPLSGIKLPPALPDYVQPVEPKITTLPNGVKIASLKSEVCPWKCLFFSISCFPETGD